MRECGVKTPKNHKKNFPNADFVLFVCLDASKTSTRVYTEEDNRPTSALIKFVPKDIVDTRHFVRTAAHEIAHGLGFDVGRMRKLKKIKSGTVGAIGKVTAVDSEIMQEMMRKHYGCTLQHITGMYMEDENNGEYKLHWERRIAKDELMSPYTGEPSGMFYTNLTLAAFHSMPFYSANFNMAEPMSWGKQTGCDLLHNTCTGSREELMKQTSMFCDKNGPVLQCTSDRFALGMCSSTPVPDTLSTVYHYFDKIASAGKDEMTNGCPIIKPLKETTCESGNVELMPGSIVSNMSRCLNVEGTKLTYGTKNEVTVKGICAKVKCENDKVSVQYKGKEGPNDWIECEKDGDKITLEGSAFNGGSIVCPKYSEVCTGLNETDLPTIEYDEKNNDNSNASEIPSPNVDSPEKNDSSETEKAPQTEGSNPQEKPSQEEDTQNAEIPSKEGGLSNPESPDNNDTTNIENGQDDHNTGNDLTDSKVENTNSPTGVISGKDTDNSIIALSFFGPLMLLVCVVA
ncbi:surface protease GP63, partial [Trypanosoma theileri]